MALTTVAAVKTYLKISDSSEDTFLTAVLAYADALIKRYLNQNIESATYTEYYSGNGTRHIRLRQRPVTSITSVYLDSGGYFGTGTDAFASTTLLTAGTDYTIVKDQSDGSSKSGLLERLNGMWPQVAVRTVGMLTPAYENNRGNIKVTYVGGYSSIPDDLVFAEILTVANIRFMQPHGARLQSEGYEDYNYSLASMARPEDILSPVRSILSRYRPLEL